MQAHLFAALRRVRLIPEECTAPLNSLRYSRCGRTDKGVSALGQVRVCGCFYRLWTDSADLWEEVVKHACPEP